MHYLEKPLKYGALNLYRTHTWYDNGTIDGSTIDTLIGCSKVALNLILVLQCISLAIEATSIKLTSEVEGLE